jgi:hypothetical protein
MGGRGGDTDDDASAVKGLLFETELPEFEELLYSIKVAAAGLASMTGGLSDDAEAAEEEDRGIEGAEEAKSWVAAVFNKVSKCSKECRRGWLRLRGARLNQDALSV